MSAAARRRTQLVWLAEFLVEQLEPVRRAHARGPAPAERDRLRATIDRLLMYVPAPGSPANLYTRTGIPRTHNAWEMQYLVDGGLLFGLYARCGAAVRSCRDRSALADEIATILADLDPREPGRLLQCSRDYYANGIADFIQRDRALRSAQFDEVEVAFECAVILAYLRLAIIAGDAIVTLDLFPTHTGPDNVVEGLKGLVSDPLTGVAHRRARRFYCCRAESYTRYYGLNLARELAAQTGANLLRFALVVPYANGVRQVALTRCWPIDGAEHTARYVGELRRAWAEFEGRTGAGQPPKILVSGYSQGGAAARLFDEALHRDDVLARRYFRESVPRGLRRRCRALAQIIAGEWAGNSPIPIYTVSVATMGGVDGVAFAERFPQIAEFVEDRRGAAGVRSHGNSQAGLHLGICHDFDPARWIVPAPLLRRRRRADGPRAPSLVQILLKFAGPNLIFHGGTWTGDTERAFAQIPAAKALLDDVRARMVSPEFVDEAGYFDDRCRRAAFEHLVVGTIGYPGWAVVETFAEALRRRAAIGEPAPRTELLREPSWRCDILPEDHDYDEIVGAARRFHERQRVRVAKVLRRLDGAGLGEELREQLEARVARAHLLRERG